MALFKTGFDAMPVHIQLDPAQIRGIEDLLKGIKGGFARTMYWAINATLLWGRTRLAQNIGGKLNLKASVIKDNIKKIDATPQNLRGELRLSGAQIPALQYGATQRVRIAGGGVFHYTSRKTATIKMGGKPGPVKVKFFRKGESSRIPHAFIEFMQSGHRDVFINQASKPKSVPRHGRYAGRKIKRGLRKGQPLTRRPIRIVFGPSLAVAFRKLDGNTGIERRAMEEQLRKNIESKLAGVLAGKGAPA